MCVCMRERERVCERENVYACEYSEKLVLKMKI